MWELNKNAHVTPRELVRHFWHVTLQLAFLISAPDVSDESGQGSHFEEYWCRTT